MCEHPPIESAQANQSTTDLGSPSPANTAPRIGYGRSWAVEGGAKEGEQEGDRESVFPPRDGMEGLMEIWRRKVK